MKLLIVNANKLFEDGCFEVDVAGKEGMDIDVCERSVPAANFHLCGVPLELILAKCQKSAWKKKGSGE